MGVLTAETEPGMMGNRALTVLASWRAPPQGIGGITGGTSFRIDAHQGGEAKPMFRNSAHVYDLIYEASGKDYAAEARDLNQQIKDRAPDAVSLLDVACGTGGHLVHLRQWYDVVGVDLDPGMLEVAHGRLPDTALFEAD